MTHPGHFPHRAGHVREMMRCNAAGYYVKAAVGEGEAFTVALEEAHVAHSTFLCQTTGFRKHGSREIQANHLPYMRRKGQRIMAGSRGHIEHQLMAFGSHLGHEALQTCPLCMYGTGRVRSCVCPIQLLHLRFFIYCCHVHPPALSIAALRSLHITLSTLKPGAAARNTRVTVYLNVPTRVCSTPGTPRRPRTGRHTQPVRGAQKLSAQCSSPQS